MRILTFLVATFSLTAALFGDLVIVQDVDAMGQHMTMTMKTKGTLLRMDINPQISVIMDSATGDMKTLMHDQKMVMTMNMESMKGMMESMSAKNANADAKPEIKATGNKEKIDGYDTEEYIVTQGNTVSHLWIAKDFPHYEAFKKAMEAMKSGPIGKMNPNLQLDLSILPGMPLKTIVEMNGKTTATSVIKSVEEKDLDVADFAPPTGYAPMTMPSMPPASSAPVSPADK